MKRLLFLILFIPSVAFSGVFSDNVTSKNSDDFISVSLDSGIWLSVPKSEIVFEINEPDKEIILYYPGREQLKKFKYNDNESAWKFIKYIIPNQKCLTDKGLMDCDDAGMLKEIK